jgi:hypothetical protein
LFVAATGVALFFDQRADAYLTPSLTAQPVEGFLVVAHRGASRVAPENTLAAFRKAVELGANAIEGDVLFTRDDVPIIAHHYDLSDYGIPADLSRLTLAEAQQLDVGSWFSPEFRDQRIPSVAEALDFLRGKVDRVYLHDKKENEYGGPGRRRIEILAEVIRRSGMQDRVVVMVEGSDLELWSELAPDIAVLKCWTAPRTARGSFSLADGFGLGLRHFGIYHGARGLRWHGELLYRLGLRRLGLYVGRWPTRAEVAASAPAAATSPSSRSMTSTCAALPRRRLPRHRHRRPHPAAFPHSLRSVSASAYSASSA